METLSAVIALLICVGCAWIWRINNKYPEHKEEDYKKEHGIDKTKE